jgi:hypothetical protein
MFTRKAKNTASDSNDKILKHLTVGTPGREGAIARSALSHAPLVLTTEGDLPFDAQHV